MIMLLSNLLNKGIVINTYKNILDYGVLVKTT